MLLCACGDARRSARRATARSKPCGAIGVLAGRADHQPDGRSRGVVRCSHHLIERDGRFGPPVRSDAKGRAISPRLPTRRIPGIVRTRATDVRIGVRRSATRASGGAKGQSVVRAQHGVETDGASTDHQGAAPWWSGLRSIGAILCAARTRGGANCALPIRGHPYCTHRIARLRQLVEQWLLRRRGATTRALQRQIRK